MPFTTYLWAVDVRAEQVVAIEHVALGVLARTPFHSCLATCTRLTLHRTLCRQEKKRVFSTQDDCVEEKGVLGCIYPLWGILVG